MEKEQIDWNIDTSQRRPVGPTTAFMVIKYILLTVLGIDVFVLFFMVLFALFMPLSHADTGNYNVNSLRGAIVVVLLLFLGFTVMLLVGVVKENFCLIMTTAVVLFISAMGTIGRSSDNKSCLFTGIVWFGIDVLCFVFAAMVKKNRLASPPSYAP